MVLNKLFSKLQDGVFGRSMMGRESKFIFNKIIYYIEGKLFFFS